MQAIVHVSALLFSLDQAGMIKDAEVMRDIHKLLIEQFCDFADRSRAVPQQIHNPQPDWFTQRLQLFGALVGLKAIPNHVEAFPTNVLKQIRLI